MQVLSAGFLIILVSIGGCNDYASNFNVTGDENNNGQLNPLHIDALHPAITGGERKIINDEQREEIGIPEDSAIASISKSFAANPSRESSAVVDFRETLVDNLVVMKSEVITVKKKFTQRSRPTHSHQFPQTGVVGEIITETFTQDEKGVLDILLVIDNSQSMERVHTEVSTKLPSLLNYVADSDWKIAIIPTDRKECIRQIITKDTPDYEEVFSRTIIGLGINGSPREETILMAHRGLKGECHRQFFNWLRDNSSLVVILVSDEDHQCYINPNYNERTRKYNDVLCYKSRWGTSIPINAEETKKLYQPIVDFYNYLREIREPKLTAKVYGILNPNSDGHNRDSGNKRFLRWRSDKNEELFDSTASIFGDYNTILQDISQDISVILKEQFSLQQVPDPGTLEVSITTDNAQTILSPDQYMVSDKTLTLSQPPDEGAVIDISYAYNSKPFIKDFALPHVPFPGSVEVSVASDDQISPVDASEYSVFDRTVSFYDAPAEGAIVYITYKEDVEMQTIFVLDEGIVNALRITVDGEEVSEFTFNASTNTVIFHDDFIPAEGAVIEASYSSIVEDMLAYPLAVPDLVDRDAIFCFAKDDPSLAVTCHYQVIDGQDMIVFAPQEFQPEREIIVRQPLSVETNNINMHENYLPDTVSIAVNGNICSISELTVEDAVIILDNPDATQGCPYLVADDVAEIFLTYSYYIVQQQFTVDSRFFDSHSYDYELWRVWVNGMKETDFKVMDFTLEFGYVLPPDSAVKIEILLY